MANDDKVKIRKVANRPASIGLIEKKAGAKVNSNPQVARLEKAPANIPGEIIGIIPEEVAKKYKIAAFERENDLVKVAMVDPGDINALNALRFVAEKEKIEIEAYLVTSQVFDEIAEFYSGPTEVIKKAVKSFKEDIVLDSDTVEKKRRKKERDFERCSSGQIGASYYQPCPGRKG